MFLEANSLGDLPRYQVEDANTFFPQSEASTAFSCCCFSWVTPNCNDAAFKLYYKALKPAGDVLLANNKNIYRLRLATYWLCMRGMTSRNYWLECRQRDFIGQFEINLAGSLVLDLYCLAGHTLKSLPERVSGEHAYSELCQRQDSCATNQTLHLKRACAE